MPVTGRWRIEEIRLSPIESSRGDAASLPLSSEADLAVVEHGLRHGVDLARKRREVLRVEHLALQIVLAVFRLYLQDVDSILLKVRVDAAEIENADKQRDLDEQDPEHGAQDRMEDGDMRHMIRWFAKEHKTAPFLSLNSHSALKGLKRCKRILIPGFKAFVGKELRRGLFKALSLRQCLFDRGAVSACLIAHGIFKNGAGVRAAGEGVGRVEMVFVDRVDCGGEDFVHLIAEGKTAYADRVDGVALVRDGEVA